MDLYMPWRINPQSHLRARKIQHLNSDVVAYREALALPSCQNQHLSYSLSRIEESRLQGWIQRFNALGAIQNSLSLHSGDD